ncbi:MAG TPA: hypothetical protein PKW35_02495 [Nannocystaceae bacterium]|nr:hypothetical protein [Nannocystaceae bacterium]
MPAWSTEPLAWLARQDDPPLYVLVAAILLAAFLGVWSRRGAPPSAPAEGSSRR